MTSVRLGTRASELGAFLVAMGLIGGAPTFLGAALGHSSTNEPVSVANLTLAAASVLQVVVSQLMGVAAQAKHEDRHPAAPDHCRHRPGVRGLGGGREPSTRTCVEGFASWRR